MDAALTMIAVAVALGGGGFVVLTVVGVLLIARRSRRERLSRPERRELDGAELLRADEALRLASDEFHFAVAQFGEEGAAPYREALDRARDELRRAFELQQRIAASPAADPRRRRDWSRDVAAIARRVSAGLEAEKRRYAERRGTEANASATIAALRSRAAALRSRTDEADGIAATLGGDYTAALLAPIAENPAEARNLVDSAEARLDEAEAEVVAQQVTAVGGTLQAAQEALARAEALVDAVGRRRDELAAADAGLERLREELRAELDEARALRDDPPDADSADEVARAMEAVEAELRRRPVTGPRDPVAALDALVVAAERLDAATADARNQQRRLAGARGALDGALLSARTQIAAVRDYIGGRHGSVGVDARTRLAEAERQLLLAENEADPVAALDAARRAATHARDADALARYRG